jgi:hypothetical protein
MGVWWWSVPLAGLGLVGQYLAGRRSWSAWVVGLVDEGLWLAYAVWTAQWMFGVSALVYSWVYLRNLRSWRGEHNARVRAADRSWRLLARSTGGGRRVVLRWAAALIVPTGFAFACSAGSSSLTPTAVPDSFGHGRQLAVGAAPSPAAVPTLTRSATVARARECGMAVPWADGGRADALVKCRRRLVWRDRRWVAAEAAVLR